LGQRTLQLGSPSGGVNFFNAICRLLVYEGSFSTRFSDLPISTDSFVCAESVSAGRLRSAFSVSIDPFQLITVMVLSTAIILNSRQVGCIRSENCFQIDRSIEMSSRFNSTGTLTCSVGYGFVQLYFASADRSLSHFHFFFRERHFNGAFAGRLSWLGTDLCL
jgi:hypothetical protein